MVAKRNSASYTKTKLFDLTSQILSTKPAGAGVLSTEIVDEFLKDFDSIPKEEIKVVLRVGLMVLAGRVTTMNKSHPSQLDIFVREGLPEFVDLRVPSDGKLETQRFDVRKLTPNQIARHSPRSSKNKLTSKRDNLIEWARQRIGAGFGDIAVEHS
jgi:hypothetical protein